MDPTQLASLFGQGSSGNSASSGATGGRTGDFALSFGNFGGLNLGSPQGIDPRWLIGGAVAVAFFFAVVMTKRKR